MKTKMTNQLPDTTKAVAEHFLSLDQDVFDPDDWPEGAEEDLYKRIAEIAIEADRKVLADAGWVLIRTRDEEGNPLIAATEEAMKQIVNITKEEFKKALADTGYEIRKSEINIDQTNDTETIHQKYASLIARVEALEEEQKQYLIQNEELFMQAVECLAFSEAFMSTQPNVSLSELAKSHQVQDELMARIDMHITNRYKKENE